MDTLFSRRHVIKQVWVQPSTHEARNYKTPLNGLDSAFFLLGEVPVVWAWKNHKLDFELLRIGLERTLNRIPPAAGRVCAGKQSMEISNVGSKGCLLELQIANRMPSEEASTAEWIPYGTPEPLIPLEPIDVPLVSARLTHFREGGCSLHVRMSHLLTDGAGVVKFMQMWSWETAQAANCPQPLPASNPPDLHCDHCLPQEKTKKVMEKMTQEDLDQRLSLLEVMRFAPAGLVTKATDAVADFEFAVEAMEDLKRNIQITLGEGRWVSSYEAFMGLAVYCLARAEGKSEIGARAVVNIRGRGSGLVGDNYFGVGLSAHEIESIPARGEKTDMRGIAESAWAIHESLRGGLQDMTEMEKLPLIPEALDATKIGSIGRLFNGRELMLERARYLTIWENCIFKDIPVINSWVGYPWFEMNFGLQGGQAAQPDFMRVPPEFRFRRHVHLSPKSKTVFQLRMQLPRGLMSKFREEFKASRFPYREVPTAAPSWFARPKQPASQTQPPTRERQVDATIVTVTRTNDRRLSSDNQPNFPLPSHVVPAQPRSLSMSAVKSRL